MVSDDRCSLVWLVTGQRQEVSLVQVNLTCEARGYPHPQIMWRREDGRSIVANGHQKKGRSESEPILLASDSGMSV